MPKDFVSPAASTSTTSNPSPAHEVQDPIASASDGPTVTVNGALASPSSADPASAAAVKAPKPTLTARLTRMFSHPKSIPTKELDATTATADQAAPDREHLAVTARDPPKGASRGSTPEQEKKSSISSGASAKSGKEGKEGEACVVWKRFEMLPDGDHAHHLKGIKRQEKLTDMLRDLVGGKRRDDAPDEQGVSLMSGWVDQFRTERDKMASDRKGGPNATPSLVEKYGRCQEIVGRGAFGVVRVAHKSDPRDGRSEQLYAVKEFRRRPHEEPRLYQKRLTSEFCISASLRHPNVIHTLDLIQDAKGDYCEVMEFCAGGDLYTLILAASKLEAVEADCFFKQLMRGVEYMHEMGVAHRDLKPENLLLTTHGALKITDFGNGECFRMAWETDARMTAGLCGSAPYIAPEEYVEAEFDPRAVDVWACGVIYMAMRTGRHLWTMARNNVEGDDFYERYLEGRRDEAGYAPIESLHRVRSH